MPAAQNEGDCPRATVASDTVFMRIRSLIGVDEGNWSGLTVDEGTPGFELVLSDGRGNSLYRITACQG